MPSKKARVKAAKAEAAKNEPPVTNKIKTGCDAQNGGVHRVWTHLLLVSADGSLDSQGNLAPSTPRL